MKKGYSENKNFNFKESLEFLNIVDYGERIFNSNSHGELFHLQQYCIMAKYLNEHGDNSWFREWFEDVISQAEGWGRPQSIYQHIGKILNADLH